MNGHARISVFQIGKEKLEGDRVQLCGLVTSFEWFEQNVKFILDDGTGAIQCFSFQNPKGLGLGSRIQLFGKVKLYQEKWELTVSRIVFVDIVFETWFAMLQGV